MTSGRYSDTAGPLVPVVSVRRRELVLEVLRSAGQQLTVAELIERLRLDGHPGETYGVISKDLNQLERYRLARSTGHPRQWTAIHIAAAAEQGVAADLEDEDAPLAADSRLEHRSVLS